METEDREMKAFIARNRKEIEALTDGKHTVGRALPASGRGTAKGTTSNPNILMGCSARIVERIANATRAPTVPVPIELARRKNF